MYFMCIPECVCVYIGVCMYIYVCRCPWKTEEGVRFIVDYHVNAEHELGSSARAANVNHWSISPANLPNFLIQYILLIFPLLPGPPCLPTHSTLYSFSLSLKNKTKHRGPLLAPQPWMNLDYRPSFRLTRAGVTGNYHHSKLEIWNMLVLKQLCSFI